MAKRCCTRCHRCCGHCTFPSIDILLRLPEVATIGRTKLQDYCDSWLQRPGRVGQLWLKCKNPACDVSMETAQEAVEGQTIHCPPCEVTCPVCGHTDRYDGNDLHLRLAE